MWTIIKLDNKKINLLKEDFSKNGILLASRKKTALCENEKQAPDGKKKRKKKNAT